MFWNFSGRSNAELVQHLWEEKTIKSTEVAKAMYAVDRSNFCPYMCYQDCPEPIGYGQTISAPHMHASAMELLLPQLNKAERVLDVGCGSGYLSAVMAHINPKMKVYALETVPELVKLSKANIMKKNGDLLSSERVVVKGTDGWHGWPAAAPYDAIHVGAAAKSMPQCLVDQLKVGGRMIIPIGPEGQVQTLMQVDKISNDAEKGVKVKKLMQVGYVPLVQSSAAATFDNGNGEKEEKPHEALETPTTTPSVRIPKAASFPSLDLPTPMDTSDQWKSLNSPLPNTPPNTREGSVLSVEGLPLSDEEISDQLSGSTRTVQTPL